MILKAKSLAGQQRAYLYKRFIAIENSAVLNTAYKTEDNIYWYFDNKIEDFVKIDNLPNMSNVQIIDVSNGKTILQYNQYYYRYLNFKWEKVTELGDDVVLLSAKYSNIGRYQTCKYYYVTSFNYVTSGTISNTTTQYLRGNVFDLQVLNIKYYNDYVDLKAEDLIVIGNRLYSVENPETSIKLQPRIYKIYYATLNSIL